MDETPIYGSTSTGMLFDLCVVHPTLWCSGQFESRVDRASDGTKSAGRKLALRGLHPKRCTYCGAQWQTTLSIVYPAEFYDSRDLHQDRFFCDPRSGEELP